MFQNAVVAHVSWRTMFSQLVKQMKRPGIVQMSKQSELHTWALLTEYSSNTCLQWANTPPRWCYPHHKCHLFTKNTSSPKHLLSLSVGIYWMTRGQSWRSVSEDFNEQHWQSNNQSTVCHKGGLFPFPTGLFEEAQSHWIRPETWKCWNVFDHYHTIFTTESA